MNPRALGAEFIGTAILVLAIVGSGIAAERLCGGNAGLALLVNAVATGGALVALILAFGSVSGAHFNPAVTAGAALRGRLSSGLAAGYIVVQFAGGFAGTVLANVLFGLGPVAFSGHERGGAAAAASEFVATFGLLCVVWGCARSQAAAIPFGVAAYIVGAYWFTPSTSFANPAVTLGRAFTDTFSGIRPLDVTPFVIAQMLGAASATGLFAIFDEERAAAAPRAAQVS